MLLPEFTRKKMATQARVNDDLVGSLLMYTYILFVQELRYRAESILVSFYTCCVDNEICKLKEWSVLNSLLTPENFIDNLSYRTMKAENYR